MDTRSIRTLIAHRRAPEFVFALALLARMAFVRIGQLGLDEQAILSQALQFYRTGHPATTGARVVHTLTLVPGSLLDLFLGLPLFLSHGLPLLSVEFAAILNGVAAYALYRLAILCFPRHPRLPVALFIAFSPWTYVFMTFSNPALIFPFGVAYLWGVILLIRKKRTFLAEALCFGSCVGLLQIHLSVAAPIALGLLLWVTRTVRIRGPGAILGIAVTGLTLLPYLWSILIQGGMGGENPFVSKNLHFEFKNLLAPFPALLRYVSLPTGELSRFIGDSDSFRGTFLFLNTRPVLWLAYLPAMAVTVWICVLLIRFLLSPVALRKPLSRCLFLAPWVLSLLFVISFKDASAQSIIVFIPFAYLTVLHVAPPSRWKLGPMIAYLCCVWAYAVPGYQHGHTPALIAVQNAALHPESVAQMKFRSTGEEYAFKSGLALLAPYAN